MPKLKTRKAAAKRYRVTGTGKIIHMKVGNKHLLEHESSKLKHNRDGNGVLTKTHVNMTKRMLALKG